MQKKFVTAMLAVCITEDEIDQVFEISGIESYLERCKFLMIPGTKYFDIPVDPRKAYPVLKQIFVDPFGSIFRRKAYVERFTDEEFLKDI